MGTGWDDVACLANHGSGSDVGCMPSQPPNQFIIAEYKNKVKYRNMTWGSQ